MTGSALVTGGSRGLGRALVRELVARGHRVIVLDVVPYDEPLDEEGDSEGQVAFREVDLGALRPADLADLPPLDLVVCNAGVTAVGDFAELTPEEDRRVLEVNVIGHMNLVKRLLADDRISSGGRIAFVASASVHVPWPVAVAYAASKAALDGFAVALESYLTSRSISVTRVFPGAMRTGHGGYARATGKPVGVAPEVVAPRVVRAIEKRRRRCFPDAMGLGLSIACSLFPRTMSRLIQRRLDLAATRQR